MSKANYRVQLCIGMDSLHRDFSEARCALRCWKRLAQELKGYVPNDSRNHTYVRLWNLNLDRVLMSTEGIFTYTTTDPEMVDALASEGTEEARQ
jgi:hypothetical protein